MERDTVVLYIVSNVHDCFLVLVEIRPASVKCLEEVEQVFLLHIFTGDNLLNFSKHLLVDVKGSLPVKFSEITLYVSCSFKRLQLISNSLKQHFLDLLDHFLLSNKPFSLVE